MYKFLEPENLKREIILSEKAAYEKHRIPKFAVIPYFKPKPSYSMAGFSQEVTCQISSNLSEEQARKELQKLLAECWDKIFFDANGKQIFFVSLPKIDIQHLSDGGYALTATYCFKNNFSLDTLDFRRINNNKIDRTGVLDDKGFCDKEVKFSVESSLEEANYRICKEASKIVFNHFFYGSEYGSGLICEHPDSHVKIRLDNTEKTIFDFNQLLINFLEFGESYEQPMLFLPSSILLNFANTLMPTTDSLLSYLNYSSVYTEVSGNPIELSILDRNNYGLLTFIDPSVLTFCFSEPIICSVSSTSYETPRFHCELHFSHINYKKPKYIKTLSFVR